MSDESAKTLTCPTCGAALEIDGESTVVHCGYCRNSSRLPPAEDAVLARKLDPVRALIQGGDIIGAIKKFQDVFGLGLKESKDAVEALRDGRPIGSS